MSEFGQPRQEELRAPRNDGLLLATAADVEGIAAVMSQAAAFKLEQGDTIWGEGDFTPEEVTQMLATGDLYTFKVDGMTAASLLLTHSDTRVWGEAGADETALYIHKLCTGSEYRGTGLGGRVMRAAEDHALAQGKTALRLDCSFDNHGLRAYYEGQGYVYVGQFVRPDGVAGRDPSASQYIAAKYQKDLPSTLA